MTSESSGRPVVGLQASPGMPPRGRIRFFFGSKRALVVIFGDFFFSQMVFFGFWCAVLFFSIFRFGVLQGPLRTLKNHEKQCTVIKNQGSADF